MFNFDKIFFYCQTKSTFYFIHIVRILIPLKYSKRKKDIFIADTNSEMLLYAYAQ